MAVSTATASPTTGPAKKTAGLCSTTVPRPSALAGIGKAVIASTGSRLRRMASASSKDAYDKARKRHADEQQATWAGAQRRAQDIWARLPVARADHPYLAEKQVAPGPCRLTCNGRLVVPVYDADRDDLISLQFISGDGGKKFLAGGRTGGGHCRLGLLRGAATIIICEGYATGATLHAATGDPVVIAFTCGNLLAVGKALRARYANARIVFAADNDEATAGNPGVSKAMEAAFEIGARFAVPRRPGDFNDLAADYGIEAVRLSIAALADAQAKAELDALVGPMREPDEMALVRLSRLTALQYDRVRQAEAKKLGIKLSTLDAEVAKRRNRQKQSAEAPPPPTKTLKDLEARRLRHLSPRTPFSIASPKRSASASPARRKSQAALSDRHLAAVRKDHARGDQGRFLVGQIGDPDRGARLHSAGGRDFVHHAVGKGAALHDGRLRPQDPLHGRGKGPGEQDFQDYLLRELMSEGILRYPVPQKVGNDIVTVTIVKRGPVTFLVTTTRASLHQENETRMLSMETDDSEAQTEAVMEKIAEIEGEGSVEAISYATWHDYQRWLAAGERRVVIPWARSLRKLIRANAVRLRRDFGQLLRAIKAHALLHRFHREKDAKGRIIATIDADDDGEAGAAKVKGDYEAVRDLFADIIAEAAEVKVSKTVAATVEAVARLAAKRPEEGSQRQYPGDRRCDRTGGCPTSANRPQRRATASAQRREQGTHRQSGETAAALPPKLLEDAAGRCRHRGFVADRRNPEGRL